MDNQEKIDEILKDATQNENEIKKDEKKAYPEYLLSNAKTSEEKEQIQKTIKNFLEIYEEEKDEE